MKHKLHFFVVPAALVYAAAACPAFAQNTDGYYLLTDNGLNNPQYSEYKAQPLLKTEGTYYATPAFNKDVANRGEVGTINAPTPFATGFLTNGDSTTDSKRVAFPYAYWTGTTKAALTFDLKKRYFIHKVRARVLVVPNVHGVEKISVFTWEDFTQEAGGEPTKTVSAADGWNELVVNKSTDKLKLEFSQLAKHPYMTVSEVEIWGKETSEPAPPARPTPTAANRPYRAFDFGPADSPLMSGFTAVDSEAVYSREKGFGWVPLSDAEDTGVSRLGSSSKFAPGLMQRDRGKEVLISDALQRDFVGAQRVYHPQLAQEFKLDLPNGEYLLLMTSGDMVYGKLGELPMTVDAEGKRVVSRVLYDKDVLANTQFETAVSDGQLNLRFDSSDATDNANWNLSGLLIFPINTDAEKNAALKAVGDFKTEIQTLHQTTFNKIFKKVERIEPNKLWDLTATEKARGYILFARDWMEMVYPNTIPRAEEAQNLVLKAAAARGEYEPATLGIYPLGKLKADVEISDLTDEKGNKISLQNIEARVVGYLPERIKPEPRTTGGITYYLSGGSTSTNYMEKVPKVLWPHRGPVDVEGTRQLWLTFHAPANAVPGLYKGTLSFKPQNRPVQSVPVEFTVYPFALQKSERTQGMYWYEAGGDRELRRKELADMARHGIRAVVLGPYSAPELKNQNGQVSFDFSQMDEMVADLKAAGVTGTIPFLTQGLASTRMRAFVRANPNLKLSYNDVFKLMVAAMQKHAREKEWPQLLFYPVDEIGNSPKNLEEFKHMGKLIREAAPDAKIYVTANDFAAGTDAREFIDYQTVNIALTREQEKEILQRGKVYMRYGNSYNNNPRISRTVSGYGFWRIPATAMYYWHYQWVNADPLNALDSTGRDHISSYPSPDGPVNSLDFEAIREGIDDTDYIATLQALMVQAKVQNKASDTVQAGQAILDEINSVDPSYTQYDLLEVPNSKYHEWRRRMAQTITSLQNQLK